MIRPCKRTLAAMSLSASLAACALVAGVGGSVDFADGSAYPESGGPAQGDSANDGGGDGGPFADGNTSCAALCPAKGGTCSGEVCTFDCSAAARCPSVSCPPGLACKVSCSGAGACGTITCGPGPSCTVDCTPGGTTPTCGDVTCNASTCNIGCSGDKACTSVVSNGTGTIKCCEDLACGASAPSCGSSSCALNCRVTSCDPGASKCTCSSDAGC